MVVELRIEFMNVFDIVKRLLKEVKDVKVLLDDLFKIFIYLIDDMGVDLCVCLGFIRSIWSNRSNIGWFEIQGMYIFDVMMLVIWVVKIYYIFYD